MGGSEAKNLPKVHVHMYGKEELRPRRKMERLSVVWETEIDPRERH